MRDRTGYILSSHDIKLKLWNSLTIDFVDVKHLHRFRKQLNTFVEEKSIGNYLKERLYNQVTIPAKNWVCIKNYYPYLSFLCKAMLWKKIDGLWIHLDMPILMFFITE